MTAVEFYAEKSMELEIRYAKGYIFINEMLNELSDLLEQAKEIEKEQIFQAYSIGFSNGAAGFYITPIDYYKHTFKNK